MRTNNGKDGTPQHGTCFLCGTICGSEYFCYGCHTFICNDCMDVDDDPDGQHQPIQHKGRIMASDVS